MSAPRREAGARQAAPTCADFVCHVRPRREVVHVVPEGDLDLATVGEVEQRLGELRDAGFDRLVLDLRELTFIDLAGLRLAERWSAAAERDGFAFDVLSGAPAVQRLLDVLDGVHRLRPVRDAAEQPGEVRCRT
jgi:anti-sigma B factor antagonist